MVSLPRPLARCIEPIADLAYEPTTYTLLCQGNHYHYRKPSRNHYKPYPLSGRYLKRLSFPGKYTTWENMDSKIDIGYKQGSSHHSNCH
jgi:hypothetical protein